MQTKSIMQSTKNLPTWLAHLADAIFEGLPKEEAAQFKVDLQEAIPLNADVEKVRHICSIARLSRVLKLLETKEGPLKEKCSAAIQGVIAYCESELVSTAIKEMQCQELVSREAVRNAASKVVKEILAKMSAKMSAEMPAEMSTWGLVMLAAAESAEWVAKAVDWAAVESAECAVEAVDWAAWGAETAAGTAWEAVRAARTTAYQAERNTLLAALRTVEV